MRRVFPIVWISCVLLACNGYGDQLQACVRDSRTLEESQACRCRVNQAQNPPRPCTPAVDGGAS